VFGSTGGELLGGRPFDPLGCQFGFEFRYAAGMLGHLPGCRQGMLAGRVFLCCGRGGSVWVQASG
jgi:hypothetical protein